MAQVLYTDFLLYAAAVKLVHDIFGAQSQRAAVDFAAADTDERLEFQIVTTDTGRQLCSSRRTEQLSLFQY